MMMFSVSYSTLQSASFSHFVPHKHSYVQGKFFLLHEHLSIEQLVLQWQLTNLMMAYGAGGTFVAIGSIWPLLS